VAPQNQNRRRKRVTVGILALEVPRNPLKYASRDLRVATTMRAGDSANIGHAPEGRSPGQSS
jgi:hypothetical protein